MLKRNGIILPEMFRSLRSRKTTRPEASSQVSPSQVQQSVPVSQDGSEVVAYENKKPFLSSRRSIHWEWEVILLEKDLNLKRKAMKRRKKVMGLRWPVLIEVLIRLRREFVVNDTIYNKKKVQRVQSLKTLTSLVACRPCV